ncbi:MAG: hypothetical protein F4Z28_13370 [Gammaproteobacteria bacterium]|nr:hypothetical protein [Gammaproteobacteria bacterium]
MLDPWPNRSLGWQVGEWCEGNLLVPEGPRYNEPWEFTEEQMHFLVRWYEVDALGDFVWRRGVLRRAKGWGKDPVAAAIVLAELLGPVRYAGNGTHTGVPKGRQEHAPRIDIVGVNEDSTQNTTTLFDPMLSPAAAAEHRWYAREKIFRAYPNGLKSEIRPVTASHRGREGARRTFYVIGETHQMVKGNGGIRMDEVVSRNLAKRVGGQARALAITNAHDPTEESVAERDYDSHVEQNKAEYKGVRDILYDSLEAEIDDSFDFDDDDQVKAALKQAYGDSYWVPLDRILKTIRDPKTSVGEAHRFYFNRIVAGVSSWMDPETWDKAYDPRKLPKKKTPIALGFDGSRRRDATGIVATDMDTGFQWVAGVWEKDWLDPEWEVSEEQVNHTMDELFADYKVIRAYFDPPFWEAAVREWIGKWPGVAAAYYTAGSNNLKIARALAAYHDAISTRACTHGGRSGEVFRRHVLAAVTREVGGRAGEEESLVTIWKKSKDSRESIDLGMAGMISWQARLDAITAGWRARKKFRVVPNPEWDD